MEESKGEVMTLLSNFKREFKKNFFFFLREEEGAPKFEKDGETRNRVCVGQATALSN